MKVANEQEAIEMMMDLRNKGIGYRLIAKALEEKKIKTSTGKIRWHPKVVRQILERMGRMGD